MKPTDYITLVIQIFRESSPDTINLRLPQYGKIYTCKDIIIDDGEYFLRIEEFSFGYNIKIDEELSLTTKVWRVVEPMEIEELLLQEKHKTDIREIITI